MCAAPRHRPGWGTDPGELAAAVGPQTAAVLVMGPAMPTGAVFGAEHFEALAEPVNRLGAWVIYDAAMERIRFDGSPLRIRPRTLGSPRARSPSARRRRNCA